MNICEFSFVHRNATQKNNNNTETDRKCGYVWARIKAITEMSPKESGIKIRLYYNTV